MVEGGSGAHERLIVQLCSYTAYTPPVLLLGSILRQRAEADPQGDQR